MRSASLISFYLLISVLAWGQLPKAKKIKVHNKELQSYISAHPEIAFIEFSKEDISELELSPDSAITTGKERPPDNIYRFDYSGHRYLFEQKFGLFPKKALLQLLDSLKPASCYMYWYRGKITAGSLQITVYSYCSSGNRNRVFRAVRYPVSYPGGQEALGNYLQEKIAASIHSLPSPPVDSAFFFRILVKRDSLVHEVKLLNHAGSALSDH